MSSTAMRPLLLCIIFVSILVHASGTTDIETLFDNDLSNTIARVIRNQEAYQVQVETNQNQTTVILSEMASVLNLVVRMLQDMNECFSRPCQNRGQCVNGDNGYTCKCQVGWTGVNCEKDVDECTSAPCHNGGLCIDGVNNYTCQCLDGWTGILCEIDMALPSVTDVNTTSVTLQWDKPPPELTGTPRRNITQYAVTFTSQDSGAPEVMLVPAENDTVYTVAGLKPATTYTIKVNFVIDTEGQGELTYSNGVLRLNVTSAIDECSSSPCQNGGQCSDGVNQYICQCTKGWTGDSCEMNKDECASSPCTNGSKCIDGVNNYTCECIAGWTGNLCETNIDECSSVPCHNEGRCIDGVNQLTCQCVRGYTGYFCENSPTCQPGNFLCDDGRCIPNEWICDNYPDCENGTDEEETTCAVCPFKFLCTNGRCIDLEYVCDGTNQCRDNSDEDLICVDASPPSVYAKSNPSPSSVYAKSNISTPTTSVVGALITLQWNAVRELPGNPRRNITQYVVTVTRKGSGESQVVRVTAEDDAVYTVTGLQPVTTYEIDVDVTIDTEGQGEQIYTIGIPTLTVNTTYTSTLTKSVVGALITLQWSAVRKLMGNPRRNITHYVVTVTRKDDRESQVVLVTAEDDAVYTVTGLQPVTTYEIDVDVTIDTEGQDEQVYTIGIPTLSVNTAYMTAPTVERLGRTSITLQLNESTPQLKGTPRRNITQYIVTATPQGGGESRLVYVAVEGELYYMMCSIEGLQPDTTYDIGMDVIISTEGQGEQVYDIGIPIVTVTTHPPCEANLFLCYDGSCIPSNWVCDEFPDCEHGTDEEETTCITCPYKFLCSNGRCVDLSDVCDGTNNCEDNSDEDQICLNVSTSTSSVYRTSFTLQWNALLELTGNPQRNITQYAVIVTRQDGGQSQVVFVPTGDTAYNVTGLQPGTDYVIGLHVVTNTEGQGEQTFDIGIPEVAVSTTLTCLDYLGMESGDIPDGNIQASTYYNTNYYPYHGRLNGNTAWLAANGDNNPWIQTDIGYPTYVSGVDTQGSEYNGVWLTSFKVSTFSTTTSSPETYIRDSGGSIKVFQGNTDTTSIVTSTFPEPVFVRIVRITCLEKHGGYWVVRFEILGCKVDDLTEA